MPDGSCVDFFVDAGYNLEIYPDYGEPSRLGMCHVVRMTASRVSFQFFVKGTSAFPAQMWLGFYSVDAGWSGWFQGAIAISPQEYNLTTTNGRITYSKDQFGRVYLYIYLTGIAISENKIIGALPVGYRPSYLVSTLARIGGSFGTIDISTAGNIALCNTYDSTERGGIFASASFLAS